LSYFYGLSANETLPNTLLAGDRNLVTGANNPNNLGANASSIPASSSGTVVNLGSPTRGIGVAVTPLLPYGWNNEIHQVNGDLLLGDGSCQQETTGAFIGQLQASDDPNNKVIFPISSAGL
jgi:hypothetical protein